VSEVPPPDWAALYQKHRDAMYRVAARVLREAGRAAEAEDAVMAAMESLLKSPPSGVTCWEAVMVNAVRWRALDILNSGAARHSVSEDPASYDQQDPMDLASDVAELVDRRRAAGVVRDKLAVLDERHRHVAWEYIARERPRPEVAAELGVTPPRVSQMAKEALRQLHKAMEPEGVRP